MSLLVALLNSWSVSIFGSVLSAYFCGALNTRRNRLIFWLAMAAITMLQVLVYAVGDAELVRKIYPLVTHLLLLLVLCVLTGRMLWPLVSVLFAYLCCQVRRWIALVLVFAFSGGSMMQDVVELVLTIPLLLLLVRFVAPVVCRLGNSSVKAQALYGLIPALYYVFDYLTVVYTDLLFSGAPVVVEFMPFVCCVAYLVFLLYNSVEERKRSELLQMQKLLNLQFSQAVREIDSLRESQDLTRRYRHDLRHHLQYLSSCIDNDQPELAQGYIADICAEMEAYKVQHYCENEAANLIFSAFVGRAEKAGIVMNIQGSMPDSAQVSDNDLCVVLSNALENALNACQPFVAEGKMCAVDVQFFERDGRLFLQVKNPCGEDIRFENGIPVSDSPDHGIGVRSICAIVQRYGGVYSFSAKNGEFVLRLTL